MGPADQRPREDGRNVLVYTTPPLDGPVDVVGEAELVVYVAADEVDPAPDLVGHLCIVEEDGTSINLQEGIAYAWRNGADLRTADDIYEVRIDLGPVGRRVLAGQAIRVTLAASDFPRWDVAGRPRGGSSPRTPTRPVTQLVFHDRARPSRLTLDVVGAPA
jgi:predicted acyl esterase